MGGWFSECAEKDYVLRVSIWSVSGFVWFVSLNLLLDFAIDNGNKSGFMVVDVDDYVDPIYSSFVIISYFSIPIGKYCANYKFKTIPEFSLRNEELYSWFVILTWSGLNPRNHTNLYFESSVPSQSDQERQSIPSSVIIIIIVLEMTPTIALFGINISGSV